jgi:hypothetical protein
MACESTTRKDNTKPRGSQGIRKTRQRTLPLVKEHYRLPLRTPPQMSLDEAIIELGLGNELEHIKNHMAKVGEDDLKAYYSRELLDFEEDE